MLSIVAQKRLEENNMLYRVGEIVAMGEPQDIDHEDFLKDYENKTYLVANMVEGNEDYYLHDSHGNLVQIDGIPVPFWDCDLKYAA